MRIRRRPDCRGLSGRMSTQLCRKPKPTHFREASAQGPSNYNPWQAGGGSIMSTATPNSMTPFMRTPTRNSAGRLNAALTLLHRGRVQALRLMIGLYLQLHALYAAGGHSPYGTLSSRHEKEDAKLAEIAANGDKATAILTHGGQKHPVQRPQLRDVPDMPGTAGRCEHQRQSDQRQHIRTWTADHFAGAAADEIADQRPWPN